MTNTSSIADLEAVRARIRARLALWFVLEDVDAAGRAARLSAIVRASSGPTRPLDAAAAEAVVAGAADVAIPAHVEAALAHAGAATEDARRLVRATAWLEGRRAAHLSDVLAVEVLPRTADTPVRAAIARTLGRAGRAEELAAGIERALTADAERREHATDEDGHLLYLDPLGRPTRERLERAPRSTSRGAPLFVAPPGTGIGDGAPGEAYTEDELWQIHFHSVPHGVARLRDWTLDPLHRAFDERPRRPVERPAAPEPEVLSGRASDLASVLAYAEAARTALLELPALASHEPLFVDRALQGEIAEVVRGAIVALGRVAAAVRERLGRLPAPTEPALVPRDEDADGVPAPLWPLVLSVGGGPLAERIAAVRALTEALPTGVVPAREELAWPEPSIRDAVLSALAGSDLVAACARGDATSDALVEILDVVRAAQRTERRARRALTALIGARPAPGAPSADETAAAKREAARLAEELVARSVAETARARFENRAQRDARVVLGEASSLGLDVGERIRLVTSDEPKLKSMVGAEAEPVLRLAVSLHRLLRGPGDSEPVAVLVLGGSEASLRAELETTWLAVLRAARRTGASVYTDHGLKESVEKPETIARLVAGEPRAIAVPRRLDAHANVVGWALLDALDAWHVRRARAIVVGRSFDVARIAVAENALALEARGVRIFALAGDLATASPVELTRA